MRVYSRRFAGVAAVCLHLVFALPARALVLTGSLSDFGVNRGGVAHQVYAGVGDDFPNLAPFVDRHAEGHDDLPIFHTGVGSDVSYTIWDTRGPHGSGHLPSGGPDYDARAMYMTNDSEYLHIGIVTSLNPAGVGGFLPGDIALNPNPNPTGVLNPPPADYFFDLNQYVTQAAGYNTRSGSPSQTLAHGADWGILLPTAAAGSSGLTDVIADGTWKVTHPGGSGGFNPPPYSDVMEGTGSQIINGAFYRYSQLDFFYQRPGGGTVPVYLLEASVPLNALSGLNSQIVASWSPSCTNDYIGVQHTQDVPESGTMTLIGVGLTLMWLCRRRKRTRWTR